MEQRTLFICPFCKNGYAATSLTAFRDTHYPQCPQYLAIKEKWRKQAVAALQEHRNETSRLLIDLDDFGFLTRKEETMEEQPQPPKREKAQKARKGERSILDAPEVKAAVTGGIANLIATGMGVFQTVLSSMAEAARREPQPEESFEDPDLALAFALLGLEPTQDPRHIEAAFIATKTRETETHNRAWRVEQIELAYNTILRSLELGGR